MGADTESGGDVGEPELETPETEPEPGSDDPVDTGEPATEILEQYQENTWGSVNDLVDNSTVRDYETIDCVKRVERYIEFDEEERVQEIPVTQTERLNIEQGFADVPAQRRDELVPSEFEEGSADFARPDTERVSTCSECGGNGRMKCSNCSGGGRNSCGWCGGSGRRSDSRCSSCGGSGSKVCGDCDGTGSVACSTCDQKGETWKVDFVRREFTPQEDAVAEEAPGVPDDFVTSADGELVRTTEPGLGDSEIRREHDFYEVDAEKVQYIYDDKDYELYRMDHDEVKAESYPKNQARKALPYVAAVVGVILLVAILWQMGIF